MLFSTGLLLLGLESCVAVNGCGGFGAPLLMLGSLVVAVVLVALGLITFLSIAAAAELTRLVRF